MVEVNYKDRIANSKVNVSCGFCKQNIESNDTVYHCLSTHKVFCKLCEFKKSNSIPLCGYKFENEHSHTCLSLKVRE